MSQGVIRVAVCMPTTGRAEQARKCIEGLLTQPGVEGVELFVVASVPEDDSATKAMIASLWDTVDGLIMVQRAPGTNAVEGWNDAAARAKELDADWFVLGADDIVWHAGWLEHARRVIQLTGAEVVGFDDGGHTSIQQYAPHYMCSRWWVDEVQQGFFVPPAYQSWWFDREVCERAKSMGLYAASPLSVAEHRHPDWKTAEMDETYRRAWHLHDADKRTYLKRRAEWELGHSRSALGAAATQERKD